MFVSVIVYVMTSPTWPEEGPPSKDASERSGLTTTRVEEKVSIRHPLDARRGDVTRGRTDGVVWIYHGRLLLELDERYGDLRRRLGASRLGRGAPAGAMTVPRSKPSESPE